MEKAFSVQIALNYQSRVKNCASAIYPCNLRNPLLGRVPYLFTYRITARTTVHGDAPQAGGRGQPSNRIRQAPGLRSVQKTMRGEPTPQVSSTDDNSQREAQRPPFFHARDFHLGDVAAR